MNQNTKVVTVVTPSTVSTNTKLNVPLGSTGLGLIDESVQRGVSAKIIAKKTAAGAGDVMDEKCIVDHANNLLQIQEGTNGFTAGDEYTVLLVFGFEFRIEASSVA